MTTRRDIIDALREGLREDDRFRAAWLGGSDAMGRADGLSDIDLGAFVCEGTIDEGFSRVRAILETIAPIEHAWRLPSPTWHGSEQMFMQLEGLPGFGHVDVVLDVHRPGYEFLIVERHGSPPVLFDHDGLITPTAFDRESHEKKLRTSVENARAKFALFCSLPIKEVQRGRSVDAVHFYMNLVVRPLVDVLRAVHCPDRFDFGMRYLREDLPAGVAAEIETLAYPSSPEAIPGLIERARVMMEGALVAWDAGARSD
ncbi:MAG: nucleotidyltransferase domain-containing protein [Phycisphaerales bacterium]